MNDKKFTYTGASIILNTAYGQVILSAENKKVLLQQVELFLPDFVANENNITETTITERSV